MFGLIVAGRLVQVGCRIPPQPYWPMDQLRYDYLASDCLPAPVGCPASGGEQVPLYDTTS